MTNLFLPWDLRAAVATNYQASGTLAGTFAGLSSVIMAK